MQATLSSNRGVGMRMADVPAGVCLTAAGERAVARRFRELGRTLTKAEVRELLVPTTSRRRLTLRP